MYIGAINPLPVMDRNKLVGIVTSTDIMGVLLEAIGMNEGSVRICVLVADQIGTIAEVSAVLRDAGINIESLVTWPLRGHPGMYQLVLRLSGDDGPQAVAVLNKTHHKVISRGYHPLHQEPQPLSAAVDLSPNFQRLSPRMRVFSAQSDGNFVAQPAALWYMFSTHSGSHEPTVFNMDIMPAMPPLLGIHRLLLFY